MSFQIYKLKDLHKTNFERKERNSETWNMERNKESYNVWENWPPSSVHRGQYRRSLSETPETLIVSFGGQLDIEWIESSELQNTTINRNWFKIPSLCTQWYIRVYIGWWCPLTYVSIMLIDRFPSCCQVFNPLLKIERFQFSCYISQLSLDSIYMLNISLMQIKVL